MRLVRALAAAGAAIAFVATPTLGAAQSTHCSSTAFAGFIDTDCTTDPAPVIYVPVTRVVYVQAPRPGLDFEHGDGRPGYWYQGSLVKADNDVTIYVVWDQELHAIPDWPTYLSWGGHSDLGNVILVGSLSGMGDAIGSPVPRSR